MKTSTLTFFLAGVMAVAAFLGAYWYVSATPSHAGAGLTTGAPVYITPGSTQGFSPGVDSATTTEVYHQIGDTSTSTMIGLLNGASIIGLDIQARASSTASNLAIFVDVSNGTNAQTQDWYPVNFSTSTTNSQMLLTGIDSPFILPLATTSTNFIRKHITIPGLSGIYYRIRTEARGNGTALWARAQTQIAVPN